MISYVIVVLLVTYLCKRLVCSRESVVRTSATTLYIFLILLRSFFTSWPLRHYSFSRGLLTRASPSHGKKIRHPPSPETSHELRSLLQLHVRTCTYSLLMMIHRKKISRKTYATVLPNSQLKLFSKLCK